MSKKIHAELTEIIDAKPEVLYGILSDYIHGHPKIIPREHFPSIAVEKGGKGAGTVVLVTTKALGVENKNRLLISEPEPGRVLVEKDDKNAFTTSFILTPRDAGKKTELCISTDWQPKPGLKGYLEGLATPPVARMIYKKEMRKIAEYIKTIGRN